MSLLNILTLNNGINTQIYIEYMYIYNYIRKDMSAHKYELNYLHYLVNLT